MNVAFAVRLEDVVFGRRDAAATRRLTVYGDEVSVPALECSNGNSAPNQLVVHDTSTMLINNVDPCVRRECAAETVCCDHANLCALYEDIEMIDAHTRFGS